MWGGGGDGDGSQPECLNEPCELDGVTVIGVRPERKKSWFRRQYDFARNKLSQFRNWLGALDRRHRGDFKQDFEREYDADAGGIQFTSKNPLNPGGNEMRAGAQNVDNEYVNIDDMLFGGYSKIALPSWAGKVQDFTTGIDRAHMGVDNLSNYNPKLDTIIYTEENGTRLHDTIPKSDLPGYREKVVNGAILLVPNK